MDLHSLLSEAYEWLKGLSSGEATVFGTLLTSLGALVAWLFRKGFHKPQAGQAAAEQTHIRAVHAQEGGVDIGIVNGSAVTVYNISVPDNVVSVHAGKMDLPFEQATRITRDFLTDIEHYYRYLPLRGMGDNSGLRLKFPLVELFIPLNARLTLPRGDTLSDDLRLAGRRLTEEEKIQIGGRVDQARPVLELITEYPVLVILGDPGSGKSSIVRFLAFLLATGQGRAFAMGDYLPLLLPLAAYSEKLQTESGLSLRSFALDYFKSRMNLEGLEHLLDARLKQGKVLILLDGLDEVKEVSQRGTVVDRVQQFLCQHIGKGNRVIMTSRIIGYREVRPPEIEGLRECTLLDFDDQEIIDFIHRWTAIVERQAYSDGQVSRYEASREASELIDAVQKNTAIRKLAANPLLLTMLVIRKRQGFSLPRHRVVLYEQYIVSLLHDWLLARSLHDNAHEFPDDRKLRKVLEPLAWWLQESEPGKGLVNEEDLLAWLRAFFNDQADPDQAARQFIRDVREHSGLLIDRGGQRFGFMHLTFMEYLAGVSLAKFSQQGLQALLNGIVAHADKAEWRETILLAISHLGLNQNNDQLTTDLLMALMDAPAQQSGSHYEIAAAALADMGDGGVTISGWQQIRQRLLEQGLQNPDISAPRRVTIGKYLAEMGDPRQEVLDVDAMLFCPVPAGAFFLGSSYFDTELLDDDKSGISYNLEYAYAIARYPVTVAQFSQYVIESGNHPADADWALGSANTPVVSVSQREAVAFCDWLSRRWREQGWLPTGWRVDLPSEPEWEKAARGGEKIPAATISPLKPSGIMQALSESRDLTGNPQAKRIFPWGDEYSDLAGRMNFNMNIGEVSPVGCYPSGESPYGCDDMSGNVWDWSRSRYQDYPYPEDKELRRQRESYESSEPCVLRGGSFDDYRRYARCASRYNLDPDFCSNLIGFRVVLSPLPLDDETLIWKRE